MRCIPESVTSGVLARLAADDVDAWQAVLFPEPVT